MSRSARIFVVDDDRDIREMLELMLDGAGHRPVGCASAEEALAMLEGGDEPDLVLLDVMMPGLDGYECCRSIRKTCRAPILFLTAKTLLSDRTAAYMSGGDDFLSKPFSQAELLMKVESLLRRYREYGGKADGGASQGGDVEIDYETGAVTRGGRPVALTDKERGLLQCFIARRGRPVSVRELYETVWGEKFMNSSANLVMVHILNLRRKLEAEPESPAFIRTVWGKGYQID